MGGLRAKGYSIQEAGFQILSVLAYAILFKVILIGREPAYSIEGEGQKQKEQGILLVISSFSSEIFEKTIAYKKLVFKYFQF